MIYTVTTSPSLDLMMQLPGSLLPGSAHRVVKEELRPGGKGINISIMLHNLGIPSTAFGFVAGFSGDELMRLTAALGVNTGFLRVRRGRTRINVRIQSQERVLPESPSSAIPSVAGANTVAGKEAAVAIAGAVAAAAELSNEQTSINGLGPEISANDIQYMVRKLSALKGDDFLVLAGMVPPSLPQDIYATFFESLNPNSAPHVIVDAPADQLHAILKYHPFLIKPNLKELSDYLKWELNDAPKVLQACEHLKKEGARNILVSLGKHGAIFADEHGNAYRIAAPGGSMVDKTGAGDSMIAGFLADYTVNHSLESAAYMAVATGSATAITDGIATKEIVMQLREQMSNKMDWEEALH